MFTEKRSNGRKMWIDAVKAVAIIAVIVDHLVGVVYSNRAIQLCSFFSVTVFVFCGGITSFYSNKRHEYEKLITVLYKKFQGIMIPYIFATIIYQVCMDSEFTIKQYINYLIHFNASPPFYFIAFYIQLVLISPFIYRAVNKVNIVILIILSLIVSYLSIQYTHLGNIYGGGEYLFGGSYLLVFVLGNIWAKKASEKQTYKKQNNRKMVLLSFALVFFGVYLILYEFRLDEILKKPFGIGINPPGITLMIYGSMVFITLYYLFHKVENSKSKILIKGYRRICLIGKYSLYIFLYHKLVLYFLQENIPINNISIKRVVYVSLMLIVPMCIGIVLKKMNCYVEMIIKRRINL